MNVIKFLVQGWAAEPYNVTFQKEGNNLNAYCDCQAGVNGQHCKHRIDILLGSVSDIVSHNTSDVASVVNWLKGSDLEKAMNVVYEVETEISQLKIKLTQANKSLVKAMRE